MNRQEYKIGDLAFLDLTSYFNLDVMEIIQARYNAEELSLKPEIAIILNAYNLLQKADIYVLSAREKIEDVSYDFLTPA